MKLPRIKLRKFGRIKSPFLRSFVMVVLIAALGLSTGAGSYLVYVKKFANNNSDNSGPIRSEEDGEDKLTQHFKSDNGGVTRPVAVTFDLAPKKIIFTKSAYAGKYGQAINMGAKLLDTNGGESSAVTAISGKLSGPCGSKTIVVPVGRSYANFAYKCRLVGKFTLQLSASGLSGGSASLTIKNYELAPVITSPGAVTSEQLATGGVDVVVKSRLADGSAKVGNNVTFTLSSAACGSLSPSSSPTNDTGYASVKWSGVGVVAGTSCTISATTASGLKTSKTFIIG